MPYSDWTYNSRNPIRRFSHRRRFSQLCNLLSRYTGAGMDMLDFGCADGHLIYLLGESDSTGCTYCGYDPYPDKLTHPEVTIYDNFDEILSSGKKFHVITCLEVLEHFAPHMQRRLINQIKSVLVPGGILIVSVPVESGLSGLFKGVVRKLTDSQRRYQYTWRNLWRTLLARPLSEFRQGDGYLDHIGFYFKDLRPLLEREFEIISISHSPFPIFGAAFNSQITCILKVKD